LNLNSCISASPTASDVESLTFAETGARRGSETILLVEDEAIVRMAAAEVLASAGYNVVTAGSAAEALSKSFQLSQGIDLMLTDMIMPGMSGLDLADKFKILFPRSRILLMSGHAEQIVAHTGIAYGESDNVIPCMAKPFSVSMLMQKVRETLDANRYDCSAHS
jgi:CheY-like chemotaxis protein